MVNIPEIWPIYQKYGRNTRNMVNIGKPLSWFLDPYVIWTKMTICLKIQVLTYMAGRSLVWRCPESFQPIYCTYTGFSWIGSSIHTRGEGALSRCFGSHETSTQVGKPLITLSPLLGQTILFFCLLFVDLIYSKYQGGVYWARTFSTQSLIEFYCI